MWQPGGRGWNQKESGTKYPRTRSLTGTEQPRICSPTGTEQPRPRSPSVLPHPVRSHSLKFLEPTETVLPTRCWSFNTWAYTEIHIKLWQCVSGFSALYPSPHFLICNIWKRGSQSSVQLHGVCLCARAFMCVHIHTHTSVKSLQHVNCQFGRSLLKLDYFHLTHSGWVSQTLQCPSR